ncbi:xanthine dehydrogenase family protein molybdopterin-binding subunit [Cupriavidus agavae]|uniref:Isoquinoline 1-oxidoreductase beta subunit n=1 Tax=Cupriavidus agavae TaxID=1001822 RepID=A0A4Q7RU25_9BURK|nr:molybdopterin cofactor-binding domain-containing protein [Cupriavidus agavae]RZT36617.1 isoquinoline 1-oxidoreductase beta subunit [Cupriavidus agavae]
MTLSRRTFLIGGAGAAAAGTLAVGWALFRPDRRLDSRTAPALPESQIALNGWVLVGTDNRVTIVMSKAEMGQGIHTGAAMLLAEELEADWAQVRVVQSPIDRIYINRENLVNGLPYRDDDPREHVEFVRDFARRTSRYFGSMVTGGSTSIEDLWLPMREAGASARMMLCTAAANLWGVPVDACVAKAGRVAHAPSGRQATFGQLVPLARDLPHPYAPPLKTPGQYTLVGTSPKRLEGKAKLDGSLRFGIDVLPADLPRQSPDSPPTALLYASVLMCPTLGGKAASREVSVQGLAGVHRGFAVDGYNGGTGGVAVIADNPFIAMRALCGLRVDWDHGPAAKLSSADIMQTLERAIEDSSRQTYYEAGDAGAALRRGRARHMRYEVPYLAHGALEPVNCTALVNGGRATVWVSTQVPQAARQAVADALGLGADDVTVHQAYLGGAFGRRLEVDYVAQAAVIAAQMPGKAVQTIWSRPQDMTHDFYRPACVAKFSGALDGDGNLVAWQADSASQSVTAQVLPRTYGVPAFAARLMPDGTMAEGSFDTPYECPNVTVRHTRVDLPIPVGYWRSVGHSHQAFFVESFIDEMATAAGKDPIAFRLALLKRPEHQRHAAVLRALAEFSGWRQPARWKERGTEFARGMALHESFGSIVGQVAEVRRDGRGGYRVTRVFCVVDCGLAIHPDMVVQQMESGIVFGLSAVLEQAVTIRNGQVDQHYFSEVPLIDMETCPEIRTRVMASSGPAPHGVGEAGTPPIAPAVANAVAALTGARPYRLPLRQPPALPEAERAWPGDRWCQWSSSL